MWPALLFLAFTIVFGLPLSFALYEWLNPANVRPLGIDQNHTSNIRFFANKLKIRIAREFQANKNIRRISINHILNSGNCLYDGSSATSGRYFAAPRLKSTVAIAAQKSLPEKRLSKTKPETEIAKRRSRSIFNRVLISEAPMSLPEWFSSRREIYGMAEVTTGTHNSLYAIHSDDRLIVRRKTRIVRWAHATSIYVDTGCELRGRISASREILVERGCRFTRLNAPKISFAPSILTARLINNIHTSPETNIIPKLPPTLNAAQAIDGRLFTEGDFVLPSATLFRGDLIVNGDLVIGQSSIVVGNIKVRGNATLETGARVEGSLICARRMKIGDCCTISGPIVCETSIDIGPSVVIGDPLRNTSIIARVLRIEERVTVHGTLRAHDWATVQPFSATTSIKPFTKSFSQKGIANGSI